MKKENGITLASLVITIIVLIILASVTTYSGLGTVRSSKFTKFRQELEIVQAEVDMLYEKYIDVEEPIITNRNMTPEEQEYANNTFKEMGITDEKEKKKYQLFDKEVFESLGVDGIEGKYLVNIKKRDVISLEGFKYSGAMYYTLNQITDNVKVEHVDNHSQVIFNISTEKLNDGTWKVNITDIVYSKNVGKGIIQCKSIDSDNWSTVGSDVRDTQYSFILNKVGTYIVQIVDAAGNVGQEQFIINE